jgi:hypothetical protein
MGTLASGLGPIAGELAGAPRVYVDANMPAGIVSAMRNELGWDVLFVMEHEELRRAHDQVHYQRALDFGRTLFTLDRDFLDDAKFPALSSPGVVVISAPDQDAILRLLRDFDRDVMRAPDAALMPLRGRKQLLAPSPVQ